MQSCMCVAVTAHSFHEAATYCILLHMSNALQHSIVLQTLTSLWLKKVPFLPIMALLDHDC